jgi:hypothetical protein
MKYSGLRVLWHLKQHLPPLCQLISVRRLFENMFVIEKNNFGEFFVILAYSYYFW